MKRTETKLFEIEYIGEVLVVYEIESIIYSNNDTGYNPINESEIKLKFVEIIIDGVGVDILPQLSQKQIDAIIEQLN